MTAWEGRCQSFGAQTPYLPFLDALRRGLQLSENDLREALHHKVAEAIRAIDPALEKYLPHYLHLLSIPSAAQRLPESLQGDALRRELEESLAAGLTIAARRTPLLLILEDWHWADEASESALRRLIGLIPRYPMLVVVLYRPDQYEPAWSHPEHLTAIQLHPLELEDTAQMFRSVLGTGELPIGLMPRVHERTGGNAFYNEEMALALLELGLIVVVSGRVRLSKPVNEIELPDSVQATLRARVDRLGVETREALRLASVVGREFSRPLLERLHPAPERLSAALEALVQQDLIHPLRVVPEPAYLFKHALVQDVVYETLLLSQRKTLHEQVGAAIEALYPERLEEHYEALASHYGKTDNVEKAVEYLEKAGDKAVGISSLAEARRHYQAAFNQAGSLPPSPENRVRRIDLSLKWASASAYAASQDLIAALGESLATSRSLGDRRREARVTYWLGRMLYNTGDLTEALSMYETCVGMGRQLKNDEILALAYVTIGRTCWLAGQQHRGIENLEKGIPMIERLGNLEEAAYSYGMLGGIYSWVGRFEEGATALDQGLAIARRAKNPNREAVCLHTMASAKCMQGDWESGHLCALESYEKAQQTGNPWLGEWVRIFVGYAAFMRGEHAAGLSMMQTAVSYIDQSGSHLAMTLFGGMFVESLMLAGRTTDGMYWAEKVLAYAARGERIGLPIAHRALAIGWSQQVPSAWSEAERELETSLRLARELGHRPDEAITHFRYAECLHKKGDLPAALEQLAEAEKLFAEMEMAWWSEQAAGLRTRVEGGRPFVWFAPYADGPPKLA
jgi:tetratricopeptide (TPR) repeat protein